MKIFGKLPSRIEAIVIDIDGTVYEKESLFLKERTKREYKWLAERLGVSEKEIEKVIKERKRMLKKALKREERISLSETVFSFGIKSKEWNRIREESLPCPALYLSFLAPLKTVLIQLLKNKIKIFWATNSSRKIGEEILKVVVGKEITKSTKIIGQEKELAKPNPEFFKRLVLPELEREKVKLEKTVAVGDKEDDDGKCPIKAGFPASIVIEGPDELIKVLNFLLNKISKKGGRKYDQSQPSRAY